MPSYVVLAYVAPLALLWVVYARTRSRRQQQAATVLAAAVSEGLTEPASLHPLFDASRCLGCAACVRACPEGDVIGLIDGKAQLIEGANCIGHGACKEACPFDAITLVFGTAKRGVDIPEVGPDFQTNVPGIYIAGELGGMGLIGNAIEQGRQAVECLAPASRRRAHGQLDLIIVGAGPAGLSAGLAAKARGLRFLLIEQETFGGTVAHFPRGKIVMTRPVDLPLAGRMRFTEVSKERLIGFWGDVLNSHPLPIVYGERVQSISGSDNSFLVTTPAGTRSCASVLLAIGRRGTPRKLDVPGEDQCKVVYRLTDPQQYRGMNVLVVGGGDSALEAAADLAEEPGTTVTLSYRGESFARAKAKNRKRIELAAREGRINIRLGSQVRSIGEDAVEIEFDGRCDVLAINAVIVCAGGVLPTQFLKDIGIHMETKHGSL